MSAEVFEALSYKVPALSSPSFPGVITRVFDVDIDLLVGNTSGVAGMDTIEAGDIIRFFKLPVYAKILHGRIFSEALDAHATPTLTADLIVTDGTTTKYLINDSTTVQAGGVASTQDAGAGVGEVNELTADSAMQFVTTNEDFRVDLVFPTACATAGEDVVGVEISYTMALEPGEQPSR